MKKSGSAKKKNRRRNQKLLESMSLLFTEAEEIEAALQLIQLSFCHSSNQPQEETTTTSSCMKVKLKELQEHEEEEEEDSEVVGKTGGVSSPSSCSTITRTSVKDFGTEKTAEEDQACSSRLIRKIKKSKFRYVFDIYNNTKPLNSVHIRHN